MRFYNDLDLGPSRLSPGLFNLVEVPVGASSPTAIGNALSATRGVPAFSKFWRADYARSTECPGLLPAWCRTHQLELQGGRLSSWLRAGLSRPTAMTIFRSFVGQTIRDCINRVSRSDRQLTTRARAARRRCGVAPSSIPPSARSRRGPPSMAKKPLEPAVLPSEHGAGKQRIFVCSF